MFARVSHKSSLLLLLATVIILTAAKKPDWGTASQSTNVEVSDFIPELQGAEAYSERYSFAVDFGKKGHIGVDFTISNLGWGDGQGAVQVRIKHPDHKNYNYSKKVGRESWSFKKDRFKIQVGNTSVSYDEKASTFRIRHKNNSTSFDVNFKRNIPFWSPGNGRLEKGGSFYEFHLLSLMADVTGDVNLRGSTLKIDEPEMGYANHINTNVAPYDLGQRFSRFRTKTDGLSIIWRDIKLTEDFGGHSVTWLLVAYQGDIVFSSPSAEIELSRIKKDPKTGYRFPMALQLNAEKGSNSAKLAMHGNSFKRENLLESYGVAAKLIASTLTDPYRYIIGCKHSLQLRVGDYQATLNGHSHYTMDYTN